MPFDRPSLQGLITRNVQDAESRLTGVDAHLRRSAARSLAVTHAGGMHGLYGYLEFQSRQANPGTAEGDALESWARIWLPNGRKGAVPATGNLLLTGVDGTVIPITTSIWQRSDGAQFAATASVTIAGGVATVPVAALVPGAAGNTEAGTALNSVGLIAGLDPAATVDDDGLGNGFEKESDVDLLVRLQQRVQTPPAGGADNDYVRWALEVAGVTRAWCRPGWMGGGTVGVTFVLDNQVGGILPNPAKVDDVQAYIEAKRPVVADLIVFAPTAVPLNPTIHVVPDTAAVRTAVAAELADLLLRDNEPGKTVLWSQLNEAISLADGENDHVLSVPAADVTLAGNEISTLGVITWV